LLQASTNTQLPSEDMEALLRESDLVRSVRRGEVVQGVVMRMDQEGMLVSIGNKSEGLVPAREMRSLTPEELSDMRVGDQILTRVIEAEKEDGSSLLSVDQAREEVGWVAVEEKFLSNQLVEGTVTGHNRGGALVVVDGLKGFVPTSHLNGLQRNAVDDQEEFIGQRIGEKVCLKVLELDREKRRAIFSERLAIQEKRQSEKERVIQELEEGQVRSGKVTGTCEFGAFVDVGGADGLIHISELSWEPIQTADQVVQVGDEVEVYIMKVDLETKRIGLSLRRTSPGPWDTIYDKYQVDQIVTATVTKLTNFGAFARIDGSIEGLIHISELSYNLLQHPKEVVKEGDNLTLKILKIEPERRRLALSLKQAEGTEF